MEPARFRFGSGTRPVASASTTQPVRRSGDGTSSTSVNDLLGKSRLEHGRHRRNVLQKQIKANVIAGQDETDYETVNRVADRGPPLAGIAETSTAASEARSHSGRRRTPGPQAPDSWKNLNTTASLRAESNSTVQAASEYGNGRKWPAERRKQVYALWAEQVLRKRLHLDEAILPTGLELRIEEETDPQGGSLETTTTKGTRSLVSHCLSVLAGHLDPILPDDRNSGEKTESSWLTTDEGKMTLRKRLRVPLMVHAAFKGNSAWRGMFELFERGSAGEDEVGWSSDEDEGQEGGGDRDDAGSEWAGKNTFKPEDIEALSVLDLSFVPLPSTARQRFRGIWRDPLNLTNLTSISFAGCGLAMEDIVELLLPVNGVSPSKSHLLCLRLKDLSLAGIGARDEGGMLRAIGQIGKHLSALEFLDLSYISTLWQDAGRTILHALLTDGRIWKDQTPQPRLPALSMLGYRGVVPLSPPVFPIDHRASLLAGKTINTSPSSTELREVRRKTVLEQMRQYRKGRYVEVILD